jgi:hypothetical protein
MRPLQYILAPLLRVNMRRSKWTLVLEVVASASAWRACSACCASVSQRVPSSCCTPLQCFAQ